MRHAVEHGVEAVAHHAELVMFAGGHTDLAIAVTEAPRDLGEGPQPAGDVAGHEGGDHRPGKHREDNIDGGLPHPLAGKGGEGDDQRRLDDHHGQDRLASDGAGQVAPAPGRRARRLRRGHRAALSRSHGLRRLRRSRF